MTTTSTAENLATIATFPASLNAQVQPLSDTALRYKPEGEWSAIENVGHLIDIDIQWLARFRHMLAAETPALAAIDVDDTVRQRNYQHKDLANLLHSFAEGRAELVAFVRTLKPTHLERAGVHPTRGTITIADSIGIIVWHDGAHTAQIANAVAGVTRS